MAVPQDNNPSSITLPTPSISSPPSTDVKPSSIPNKVPSSEAKPKEQIPDIKSDKSPASYQCWTGSKDAIYTITPSYKAFSKYFIIVGKDSYLPDIQAYLMSNYGNYLSGSQLIAGFRIYNTFGDNSLDYQLLYSTNYGTFTSILTYWPDTANIQLKTLSILNFYIMEIDYSNCQVQDLAQQNCKICEDGYRNFFGRCLLYDPYCVSYITDECGKCGNGKSLSNGICK